MYTCTLPEINPVPVERGHDRVVSLLSEDLLCDVPLTDKDQEDEDPLGKVDHVRHVPGRSMIAERGFLPLVSLCNDCRLLPDPLRNLVFCCGTDDLESPNETHAEKELEVEEEAEKGITRA